MSSYTPSAADELLINAPFYHGFQTRAEAEPLIPAIEGRFLVRLIEEEQQFIYVVSVYWQGTKHHYRIRQTKNKRYYYLNRRMAKTIPNLIRFHRFTQTPVNSASGARLRRPVERTHFALYREQISTDGTVLGSGQFGKVCKGKLRLGIFTTVDVALKSISQDDKRTDPHERIRFLQEAQLMMRLKHPNIVRLYGVVNNADPVLIVTELATGGSLLDLLREMNEEAVTERTNFCRDICFGMAYLERKKVIHRDLSARNCLLGKENAVKIADFGLSRMGVRSFIYNKGCVPIQHSPPEVLPTKLKTGGRYSHKSDVWSYGVTIWEIWTSPYQEPYGEFSNWAKLRRQILEGRRLEPPTLMPKNLSTLMKSCFETDPDDRPSFHKIKEEYFGREDWSFSDVMEPVLNCLKLLFD